MGEAQRIKAVLAVDDRDYNSGLDKAEDRLEDFARKAQRAGDRAARSLGESFKKLEFDALERVGSRLTIGLTAPILAAGAAAVKVGVDMDSFRRGLTAVSGSAQSAEEQLVQLREVAKLPGLGFEEAIQGAINLEAAGMSAKMAQRSLMAVGNALATVGKGKAELEGVTYALTKIVSQGKVTEHTMQEIAIRVPQIRQVMKDAFGTSVAADIEKMGVTADDFVEKITAGLEKLPKVTGGARNDFENLQDDVTQLAAVVGTDLLKVVGPAMQQLDKWVTDVTAAWKEMSPEAKTAVGVILGVTAAVGPTILTLGFLGKSVRDISDGWKTLKDLKTVVVAALFAKKAAVDAETAALAVNTTAWQANTAAVGQGTAARYTSSAATSGGGLAAGAGRIGLGIASRLALPAAIIAGGITGAHFLNDLYDHRRGQETVGFGREMDFLNPFSDHGKHSEDERLKAERDEFAKSRAAGQSPRQRILAEQAAERDKAAARLKAEKEKKEKDREELYDAQIGMAKARAEAQSASSTRSDDAQIKERNLVPVLLDHQKEILNRAGMKKQGTEEYFKLQKQAWELEKEITDLQRGSQEEIQNNQKQAKAEADRRAKKAQEEFKKQAEEAKKAEHEQRQAVREYLSAEVERAESMVGVQPEEKRDQARLESIVPILRQNQALLVDQQKGLTPAMKEYWENVREYWSYERQIQGLQQAAADQQKQNVEKSKEAAKRNAREQLELADAKMGLAEAQLKNMFGVSDQQKKSMMIPLLMQKFTMLHRTMTGETEIEKIKRLTDAENVRGSVLSALGVDNGFARTLGGGSMPMFDMRRAQMVMRQMDMSARNADAMGPLDSMNPPVTVNVSPTLPPVGSALYQQVFQDPSFQDALGKFMQTWLLDKSRRATF
jgi:tape measure domain-containing protein